MKDQVYNCTEAPTSESVRMASFGTQSTCCASIAAHNSVGVLILRHLPCTLRHALWRAIWAIIVEQGKLNPL